MGLGLLSGKFFFYMLMTSYMCTACNSKQ